MIFGCDVPPSPACGSQRFAGCVGTITPATKSASSAASGARMSGRLKARKAARIPFPSFPSFGALSINTASPILATATSSRERRGGVHPLNLDMLSRRVISPIVGDAWKGWHGFRRSLGSNLYRLGVSPKIIQEILRHADVSTTQTHYIVVDRAETKTAMGKLERAVGKEWAKAKKRAAAK